MKKNMTKLLYYSLALLMILITCITFFPSIVSFFFAEGSDFLLTAVLVNPYIESFLVLLFCAILFIKYKSRNNKYYMNIILIFVFVLWLLNGRIIGQFPYPEEKVIAGWFFIQTDEIYICNRNKNDCENVGVSETYIDKRGFWFVELKNKETNASIFIGPFIWSKSLIFLEEFYPLNKPREVIN